MIDYSKIRAKAVDLVGWRQSTKSGSLTLDSDSIKSNSGLYYDDANALVTANNLQATQDDEAITAGSFNTLLDDIVKGAFSEVLSKVFNREDHIDTDLLYKHENVFEHPIDNVVGFQGYEVLVGKNMNVSAIINNILLEWYGDETVTIYLFNSQKKAPVYSKEVSALERDTVEAEFNQTMNTFEYFGGRWFIGYLTSGLTNRPVNRQFQEANLRYYFGDTLDIRPVFVSGWDSATMFNMEDIQYTSYSYGLNMEISVYRDFTQLVLTDLNRFARALQLQVAVRVVDIISNSVRSNKAERLSKSNALLELSGNKNNFRVPEFVGLQDKLIAEIISLRNNYYPSGIKKGTLR
jgi:hypothetical protein